MHAVWREHGPPVYVAVAAYLGLNNPKAAGRMDEDELVELLRRFPGAAGPPGS